MGEKPLFWKTRIVVEITCADADVVSQASDHLQAAINRRTDVSIRANPGKLLGFSIQTCAVIPNTANYPEPRSW
jgi:hypothetical protein